MQGTRRHSVVYLMSEATQEQINSLMARISSVESGIARMAGLEAAVAAIDDDYGEPQKRFVPESSGGVGTFEYSSYFKIYDASTPGHAKIGVKDGGNPASDNCGAVYVNGEEALVLRYASGDLSVGDYWVWLHSWMALTDDSPYFAGANGIVSITSTATGPTTPSGVGWSNQLLGRFSVTQEEGADPVLEITSQDYLRGGEHHCIIVGDCSGEVLT